MSNNSKSNCVPSSRQEQQQQEEEHGESPHRPNPSRNVNHHADHNETGALAVSGANGDSHGLRNDIRDDDTTPVQQPEQGPQQEDHTSVHSSRVDHEGLPREQAAQRCQQGDKEEMMLLMLLNCLSQQNALPKFDYVTEFFGPWARNYSMERFQETPEGLMGIMKAIAEEAEPEPKHVVNITPQMQTIFLERCHRFGLTEINPETCNTFLDWAAALSVLSVRADDRNKLFRTFSVFGVRIMSDLWYSLNLHGSLAKAELMLAVMLGREPVSKGGKLEVATELDSNRMQWQRSDNDGSIDFVFFHELTKVLFGAYDLAATAYSLKAQCSLLFGTDVKRSLVDSMDPKTRAALFWECGSRLRLFSVFRGHQLGFGVAPQVFENTPPSERQKLLLRNLDRAAAHMRQRLKDLEWHFAMYEPPEDFWVHAEPFLSEDSSLIAMTPTKQLSKLPALPESPSQEKAKTGKLSDVSILLLSLSACPCNEYTFLSHRGADVKLQLARVLKKGIDEGKLFSHNFFLDCLTMADSKDCSEVFLWRNLWKARHLVVSWTPNFLDSHWCRRELNAWQFINLLEETMGRPSNRLCSVVKQDVSMLRSSSLAPNDVTALFISSHVQYDALLSVNSTTSVVASVQDRLFEKGLLTNKNFLGFSDVNPGEAIGPTILLGNDYGYMTVSETMPLLPSRKTFEVLLKNLRLAMGGGATLASMMTIGDEMCLLCHEEDEPDVHVVVIAWEAARRQILDLVSGYVTGNDNKDKRIYDVEVLYKLFAKKISEEARETIKKRESMRMNEDYDSDDDDYLQLVQGNFQLVVFNALEIVQQVDTWISHRHDPAKMTPYHSMCRCYRFNALRYALELKEGLFGIDEMAQSDAVDVIRDTNTLRSIPRSSLEPTVTTLWASELREWIRTTHACGRILAIRTRAAEVKWLMPVLLVMAINASPIQFRICQIRRDLAVEVKTEHVPVSMVSCITGDTWDECDELLSSSVQLQASQE